MVDWAEFRDGVAETRRYLLSHHEPREWDRCYAPVVFGRRVHVCARCSGIYPGIVAGVLSYAFGPSPLTGFVLVALSPLPALVDWSVTSFTPRGGYNPLRTATGALLGYGYGLGLTRLLWSADHRVLAVGVLYGATALGLLVVSRTVLSGPDDADPA